MNLPFEHRIHSEDGYTSVIRIVNPKRPIVITFDNLFTANPDTLREGWGSSWCSKHSLNYVAYLESDGDRGYSGHGFPNLIDRTNKILDAWVFPRRICYASSMGAYAALAFAKRCLANTVLAINPISPKNKDSENWKEERFLGRRLKGWVDPWREDVFSELESVRVLTAYDPFQKLDALHAALIPGEKYIVPFLGHALERYASPIGLISHLFHLSLKADSTPEDIREFRLKARRRRNLTRYYSLICASYNSHLTVDRGGIALAFAFMNCSGSPPSTSNVEALLSGDLKWVRKEIFHRSIEMLRGTVDPEKLRLAKMIEESLLIQGRTL